MNPRRILILVLLCYGTASAGAAPAMDAQRVIAVDEGQTVVLDGIGKARFTDIVFPDAALASPWLAVHLLQQEITFRTLSEDRYGRTVITAPDAEEAMLRDGVAVLFAQGPVWPQWQAAEAAARIGRRGVWGGEGFVLNPENAAQHVQEFRVVEGAITHVYAARSATYLNFGEHWQTDFSVTIPSRNRRSFEAVLATLKPGSTVRVRGMIYPENGPMIRLTRPEQLEVVK